jgi:hypothetical protein
MAAISAFHSRFFASALLRQKELRSSRAAAIRCVRAKGKIKKYETIKRMTQTSRSYGAQYNVYISSYKHFCFSGASDLIILTTDKSIIAKKPCISLLS